MSGWWVVGLLVPAIGLALLAYLARIARLLVAATRDLDTVHLLLRATEKRTVLVPDLVSGIRDNVHNLWTAAAEIADEAVQRG